MRLDRFTVRNLELLEGLGDEGKSLISVIDRTVTPMGARLLRRWLLFPLKDVQAIRARLDVVEYFMRRRDSREELKTYLEQIGDIERLISKVGVGRVSPRELVQLKNALVALEPVRRIRLEADDQGVCHRRAAQSVRGKAREAIARTLRDDAPVALSRGAVVRDGVDSELDELRHIAYSGKDYLMEIQARESAATGIPSLKIGYNNVFGYYMEVTNTHRDKVPQEWIRKQTLVNAERYITEELKVYEEKILGFQEKIAVIEARIYAELVGQVAQYIHAIQLDATQLARLDVLTAFTRLAIENHYNRPVVDDSLDIEITGGRHPVIERQLPGREVYSQLGEPLERLYAGHDNHRTPNMSGKSALLRQTAINVLCWLRQAASWPPTVPA